MSVLDLRESLKETDKEVERLNIVGWCKTYMGGLFLEGNGDELRKTDKYDTGRDVSYTNTTYLKQELPMYDMDTLCNSQIDPIINHTIKDMQDCIFHIQCGYCYLDKDINDNWIICPVSTFTYPVPIFNYYGSELPDFIRFSIECRIVYINNEPSANFGYLPKNRRS